MANENANHKEGSAVKLLLGLNSALLTALLIFVAQMVNQSTALNQTIQDQASKIEVLRTTVNRLEVQGDRLQDQLDQIFRDYDLKLKPRWGK
jgi:cell division protein FtsB